MRLRYPNDRPTRLTVSVPLPPGKDDGDGGQEWTHDVLSPALADAQETLQGVGGQMDSRHDYQVDTDDQGAWLTVTGTVG